MRRLDEEMGKADQANRSKNPKRVQHLPVDGIGSISQSIPNGLPIDFYDPKWFNNRKSGQKRIIADLYMVAFLPDATKSLLGKPHADERLSDKQFTQQHWDEAIKPYDISHEISNDEDVNASLTKGRNELEYLVEEELSKEQNKVIELHNEPAQSDHVLNEDIEMEDANKKYHDSLFSLPNEWS
ncbi:hypothetical protein O181_021194 [Austropuccinia psidii MF-1]|uniref:Uncharacterized protein n=1 Tax=Austropuccinia psidii MF-1 TaxID=1389203 RepID=A0A9Q3GWG1_9BASI|nr:hypothetical protein [Austropuccinia psidii MF-1]